MTKSKVDLSELLGSVEVARLKLHPQLSKDLLSDVVDVVFEAGDDDAKALQSLRKLVAAADAEQEA